MCAELELWGSRCSPSYSIRVLVFTSHPKHHKNSKVNLDTTFQPSQIKVPGPPLTISLLSISQSSLVFPGLSLLLPACRSSAHTGSTSDKTPVSGILVTTTQPVPAFLL